MEKESKTLEKLQPQPGDDYDPFSDEAQKMLENRAVAATLKRQSLMNPLPAMDALIAKTNTMRENVIGDSSGSDSDEEEKIDTSTKHEGDTMTSENSTLEEKKTVAFKLPQHSFDRSSGDTGSVDEDRENNMKRMLEEMVMKTRISGETSYSVIGDEKDEEPLAPENRQTTRGELVEEILGIK